MLDKFHNIALYKFVTLLTVVWGRQFLHHKMKQHSLQWTEVRNLSTMSKSKRRLTYEDNRVALNVCQICFCNKFYYFHKVQNHLWIGSRNRRVSNTYCSSLLLTLMVAWHNLQELQQFLNFTYWILSFGIALAQTNTTTILENKLLRILGQILYMCSQISTPIWQAQFEVIRNTFVALDRVDTICGSITAYTLHQIEYSRAWSMPPRWQNTLTYIPYHQYEKDIFTVVSYRTIPPNFQDCWFDKASWGSASFPANGVLIQ
jgi:hypothetical protein